MDLKQLVLDQLAGQATGKIAKQQGLDKTTANGAVDTAVTAIIAGLQQNVSTKSGAGKLDAALASKHQGSILADVTAALGDASVQEDGVKILSHIFGDKKGAVTDSVAKQAGVSTAAAGDILGQLAPIVLDQLGKTKKSDGLDAGDLVNILVGQKTSDTAVGSVIQDILGGKRKGLVGIVLALLTLFLAKKK